MIFFPCWKPLIQHNFVLTINHPIPDRTITSSLCMYSFEYTAYQSQERKYILFYSENTNEYHSCSTRSDKVCCLRLIVKFTWSCSSCVLNSATFFSSVSACFLLVSASPWCVSNAVFKVFDVSVCSVISASLSCLWVSLTLANSCVLFSKAACYIYINNWYGGRMVGRRERWTKHGQK